MWEARRRSKYHIIYLEQRCLRLYEAEWVGMSHEWIHKRWKGEKVATGRGFGVEGRMKKGRERTFLHQPRTTSQSESSSEDRVNIRDVHLVVVLLLVGVVVVTMSKKVSPSPLIIYSYSYNVRRS